MTIKRYEELNNDQIDVLREIGSIGTGHSATALSNVLSRKIEMTLPEVKILGYNEVVAQMGGPENIVAAVMVEFTGEINGIMLYLQRLDFINLVLDNLLSSKIESYEQLNSLQVSALVEIGNIIISSYINAISSLTNININLSVPGICVNMLGGILSVPMVEYGYETDKMMLVDGKFLCDNQEVFSNLLLLPEVKSLNYLLKKLGVAGE